MMATRTNIENPSTIERAFELARSGDCRSVLEIRQRLKAERHPLVDEHLTGHSIRRELAKLCADAKRPTETEERP